MAVDPPFRSSSSFVSPTVQILFYLIWHSKLWTRLITFATPTDAGDQTNKAASPTRRVLALQGVSSPDWRRVWEKRERVWCWSFQCLPVNRNLKSFFSGLVSTERGVALYLNPLALCIDMHSESWSSWTWGFVLHFWHLISLLNLSRWEGR